MCGSLGPFLCMAGMGNSILALTYKSESFFLLQLFRHSPRGQALPVAPWHWGMSLRERNASFFPSNSFLMHIQSLFLKCSFVEAGLEQLRIHRIVAVYEQQEVFARTVWKPSHGPRRIWDAAIISGLRTYFLPFLPSQFFLQTQPTTEPSPFKRTSDSSCLPPYFSLNSNCTRGPTSWLCLFRYWVS